jgi:hypothetical protein
VYVKKEDDGSTLFTHLYVDDLIFTGNNPTMFKDFKKSMVQEFEIINIGLMTCFFWNRSDTKKNGFLYPKAVMPKIFLKSSR